MRVHVIAGYAQVLDGVAAAVATCTALDRIYIAGNAPVLLPLDMSKAEGGASTSVRGQPVDKQNEVNDEAPKVQVSPSSLPIKQRM